MYRIWESHYPVLYGSISLYGVQIGEIYMRKHEANEILAKEEEAVILAVQKTQYELDLERLDAQEKEILNNPSLTSDQKAQALSTSVNMVRQKMKTEHRKDMFSASIQHNRPLFEAVKRFASGQGIEPAWSTPEALQSILKMHTEILAKATDPAAKGCLADINVRMKEIKSFREQIKSAWDIAEQARINAQDTQVKVNEKIRLVEEELLSCGEDAFEIDPRYVVLQMPDIASKLMGEVQTVQEQKTPQTSATPNSTNSSVIGPVNFQTVAGEQIATRRTMVSDANPHHKAMLDALTMDNVKKAVEAGAKSNSNIEVLAWIGKHIVGTTEVVIDQGLNSKVSLIRQALNYPKG